MCTAYHDWTGEVWRRKIGLLNTDVFQDRGWLFVILCPLCHRWVEVRDFEETRHHVSPTIVV